MAERKRIAILISGRGSNMAALIYAARADDCPYEVALVTGDKDDASGLALAQAEGVSVSRLDAKKLGASYWHVLEKTLRETDIDVIALAGFMRILPDTFVANWQGQIVNIHPSLLPKHKGLKAHDAVLAAGEDVTGATVHLVTTALDDGPALGQVEVALIPGDTAETLAERVLIAEHQLYPRVLAEFASRETDPDWIVAKVGELTLKLPETHAKTSHGSPGWRVGSETSGKFFAYVSIRHHGEAPIALLVKTSGPDEMAALIEAKPDLYYRPAYYGASGWIALRLDGRQVDWDHVAEWLERSWRLLAPARLTRLMRAADEF
ncbi:MAG: phosphoribosylglycinamide formyltransferase [Sphingomonas sp.]|uniref:phosphoribosylglycinamide formyltransferase n=1 Tax=Sphingomonas sp. TaxID=28214 RepID=UPI00185BA965|nr:phosphoribosylglycinamide formyltransferase [Sphingomonas sp.]MBA3666126.1 phosphoribosylglycinamide formyltransferase [Sphingomonas sp.]